MTTTREQRRIAGGTVWNPPHFFVSAARAEGRPRCLACGTFIDAPPEAETSTRRGDFAIVVSWRICTCGAFARTQRLVVVERDATALRGVTASRDARRS